MSPKPIRVLQIIGIVAGGGVESVVINYYKHINREKVQFDFIVHNNNIIDITRIIEPLGGKVYKVPSYSKNIIGFMLGVYRVVKQQNYQIVHCHMTTLGIFSLLPAWLAGAHIRILHGHSTTVRHELKRNIMKEILKPFSVFIANHYFACGRLVARWLYGTEKGVSIVNNAVDVDHFQYNELYRQELRQELRLENKFIIGHIGRFMYQKNHKFLIQVFYQLIKYIPSAHLVLVGDGPLRVSILKEIESLGIGKYVTYLGIRDDVYRLYSLFDVFYLPSWYEGLAVVAVESQAANLPLLMSNYVTDEAILDNSLVKKLAITEESIYEWIVETQRIFNYRNKRKGFNNVLNEQGYNINIEAKRLEKIYQQFDKE